jgi:hypothetical protein
LPSELVDLEEEATVAGLDGVASSGDIPRHHRDTTGTAFSGNYDADSTSDFAWLSHRAVLPDVSAF